MEIYDQSGAYGKWTVTADGTERLKCLVRDSLAATFCKTKLQLDDGKWTPVPDGECPPPIKRGPFYRDIASDVSLSIYTSAPSIRIT